MIKQQNKMPLDAVLKRRKTTLKKFVQDAGIQTYPGLVTLCDRFGVSPPTKEVYERDVMPPVVTSQQDGIIVLNDVQEENKLSPSASMPKVVKDSSVEGQKVLKKRAARREKKEDRPTNQPLVTSLPDLINKDKL